MDNNIIKAIETIEKWLGEVSKTNDSNVDDTDSLRIVLLNLKVIDAHIKYEIKRETGIIPIVKQIERVKDKVHDNTDVLIKTGRAELRAAFAEVKKYVFEKEGKLND